MLVFDNLVDENLMLTKERLLVSELDLGTKEFLYLFITCSLGSHLNVETTKFEHGTTQFIDH